MFEKILNRANLIHRAITKSRLFKKDLCGACGIASRELFLYGRRAGYPIKFVYKPGHCFNMFENTIIDITAGQFDDCYINMVAIQRIEDVSKLASYWNLSYCAVVETTKQFHLLDKEKIQFKDWSEQSPYIYKFIKVNNELTFVGN